MGTQNLESIQQDYRSKLNALCGVVARINKNLSEKMICRELVKAAMELTDATAGTASLFKNGKMVCREYLRGTTVSPIDLSFERGYGVPGWVIEHRTTYLSNDAAHDPQIVPQLRDEYGVFNLITTPIIGSSDQLLGCFEMHNKRKGGFNEDDVLLLRGLASIAAIALQNARFIDQKNEYERQLQWRLEFERIINSVSTDFISISSEDMDAKINETLEIIGEFFCADRSYIFLYSEDGTKMSNTHEWSRQGIRPFMHELKDMPADSVPWFDAQMKRFETVAVNSVEELGAEALKEKEEWLRQDIQSLICVPMECRGELLGFAGFDTVLYKTQWPSDSIVFLQIVGRILANAIYRIRAYRALEGSERRYRILVENIGLGIMLIDAQQKIIMANSAIGKLLNTSAESLVGKQCYHGFEGRNIVCAHCPGAKAFSSGHAEEVETEGVRADGSKFPVRVRAFPIFENGRPDFLIEVIEDISERKKVLDELRQSRQMLELVISNFPGVVFWKDRNSVYLGCDKAFATGAGLSEVSDIAGKTDYEMPWAKTEADAYRADDRAVMESGTPRLGIIETQLQADGRVVWFETHKVPLRDVQGNVIGVLGASNDITQRKKFEDELRESEASLKSIFSAAPVGIGLVVNRVIIKANEQLCTMTGYSIKELVGQSARILYPTQEDYLYVGLEKYKQINQYGTGTVETRWKRKDGSMIDVLLSSTPLDPNNLSAGVTFTAMDITARKRANDELRQRESTLAAIFNSSPAGIGIISNGILKNINERFCLIVQYSSDELIGQSIRKLYFSADEFERAGREARSQIKEKGVANVETFWRRKDGTRVEMLLTGSLIDPSTDPDKMAFAALDITENKAITHEREELVHDLALKNEELESIVYVSSHDLRSPLVNIQGFCEELNRSCQALRLILTTADIAEDVKEKTSEIIEKDIPMELDFINSGTVKMAAIIDALLRLSRLGRAALELKVLDMNQLIANTVKNMEYQISSKDAIVTVEPLPPCLSDSVQVGQIFANLIDNALKYLDVNRPGKITISGKRQANMAVYCVEDNGIGIAPQYYQKIFELFHQLHPAKSTGQGLGLTIVKRILDRLDGKIWVESQEGKGSKFFVALPVPDASHAYLLP